VLWAGIGAFHETFHRRRRRSGETSTRLRDSAGDVRREAAARTRVDQPIHAFRSSARIAITGVETQAKRLRSGFFDQ
jgi:hypothetical protein